MNIIIIPRQDEVSVFADADGVLLTQEDVAMKAHGAPNATQTIAIPRQHIDALIAALREAKKVGRTGTPQ